METNHILVVEDDKEIREGIKIYLLSQGYQVFLAADGTRTTGSGDGCQEKRMDYGQPDTDFQHSASQRGLYGSLACHASMVIR